jgi:DNA-binding PadR family transcriptional regulator
MVRREAPPNARQAEKLTLELRRGTLVLATLCQLREPKYGYSLVQDLTAAGLEVEQGTLYPLLRRLNDQGLLESSWNVDGARPRKYYQLSRQGSTVLDSLTTHWRSLVTVLDTLLAHDGGDTDGAH